MSVMGSTVGRERERERETYTFLPLTERTPESTHSVRPVPKTTTSYSGAISSMFVVGCAGSLLEESR